MQVLILIGRWADKQTSIVNPDDDIRDEIKKYNRRIMRLQCQIQDMPRATSRKERKKVEKLHKEISHVENLKRMAQDALGSGN